jgi:phospholipid transport system substrate-binding protein
MTQNWRIFRMALAPLALVVLVAAGPGAAAAGDAEFGEGARVFVERMAVNAISSLTEPNLAKDERRRRFRAMMHEYFAFKGIAKWVLGRYWRRATQAQRDKYVQLFEDLMVISYADRFERYSGETLSVERSEVRGGKDALVHSKLVRPNGQKTIDVTWRVRSKDGIFRIVDIMVEGLSMGLTQQKEYASFIRQHGGKIENLLIELRKRIEQAT